MHNKNLKVEKWAALKEKIKVNKLRNIWRRETELNLRWWEKKRERKFPIKLKFKVFLSSL